jgi:hypothetical protein
LVWRVVAACGDKDCSEEGKVAPVDFSGGECSVIDGAKSVSGD